MIAVVQRVARARVTVDREVVGAISAGLLVLAGVRRGDATGDAARLADRVAGLRVFEDERGRMNLSVLDLRLEVLVVSQFTLCADVRRGRRPGFEDAEEPERARGLVEEFARALEGRGLRVARGRFGAAMDVTSINRGPATFLLDSRWWPALPAQKVT